MPEIFALKLLIVLIKMHKKSGIKYLFEYNPRLPLRLVANGKTLEIR